MVAGLINNLPVGPPALPALIQLYISIVSQCWLALQLSVLFPLSSVRIVWQESNDKHSVLQETVKKQQLFSACRLFDVCTS